MRSLFPASRLPYEVPAWRWHNADGAQAVIYTGEAGAPNTWADVREFLIAHGAVAQAQVADPPAIRELAAIAADQIYAPGGLGPLQDAWLRARQTFLPAGNANPALPGIVDPAPRYSGLAVDSADLRGVMEAVAAHRGWLTTAPGLWLTLRSGGQDGVWMGSDYPGGRSG